MNKTFFTSFQLYWTFKFHKQKIFFCIFILLRFREKHFFSSQFRCKVCFIKRFYVFLTLSSSTFLLLHFFFYSIYLNFLLDDLVPIFFSLHKKAYVFFPLITKKEKKNIHFLSSYIILRPLKTFESFLK